MATSSPFFINTTHLEFLAPLVKWKLLDHRGLIEEARFPFHYSALQKLTVRSEKQGILKSIKDPWSKRKFFYISELGKKLFGEGAIRQKLYDDNLVHDLKVTEVVRELLKQDSFQSAKLEHSLELKATITPDAILSGSKNGCDFIMAFELELTRKSRDRYLGKARQYLNSSFDYVLYLFPTKSILSSYRREIVSEFGDKALNRIMLFHCETLISRKMHLFDACGVFKGKEMRLEELFKN